MEQFFIFLYPAVTIISIAAYLPQVRALLFAKTAPQNISLSSWGMWCLSSFLAFGYSVFHIHDLLLSLSTGLNFTMVVITTLLIAYNRYIRFAEKPPVPGLKKATVPIRVRRY